MRLMFVYWAVEERGSAQDIYNYACVARQMGHEVALYGRPDPKSSFNYSLDVDAADAVVFLFEWTTLIKDCDNLNFLPLLSRVPRKRRVVVDLDGKYNDAISVAGDYNHDDEGASRAWVEACNSLADKIHQATPHPCRPNVRPFLFHAYNPEWERPLDFHGKQFGMYLVGNNYFRWKPVHCMLKAIEGVREEVGRIGFVGHGWDTPAPWTHPSLRQDAYYTDPDYLARLGVEVKPPIHFSQVVEEMGCGLFHPVILRPLFDHLGFVTCRTFETLAANTIPLFTQDAAYVREIYGDEAVELVFPGTRPADKIRDILRKPEKYLRIVKNMRSHLSQEHSYEARIKELIQIIQN